MHRIFEDDRDLVVAKAAVCGIKLEINHHAQGHSVFMRIDWRDASSQFQLATKAFTCSLHADARWDKMLHEMFEIIVDARLTARDHYAHIGHKLLRCHHKAAQEYHG